MENNSKDKRRMPRIVIPGGISVDDSPNTPPIEVLDISEGGIRFTCGYKLPENYEVEFWFDYYDFAFKIKCRVAWFKHTPEGAWEHGALFVHLTRAQFLTVQAYVQDLKQMVEV